jgi:hypothetical protein
VAVTTRPAKFDKVQCHLSLSQRLEQRIWKLCLVCQSKPIFYYSFKKYSGGFKQFNRLREHSTAGTP